MSQNAFREQDDRTPLLVQQEVGRALRLSFEAVTREPLSEQIVLLLLRLALSEAMRGAVEQEAGQATMVEAHRSIRVSL